MNCCKMNDDTQKIMKLLKMLSIQLAIPLVLLFCCGQPHNLPMLADIWR